MRKDAESNNFESVKAKVVKNRSESQNKINILALVSIFLISIGLSQLLGIYFPSISNGLNYIIVGLIILLTSILFNKK